MSRLPRGFPGVPHRPHVVVRRRRRRARYRLRKWMTGVFTLLGCMLFMSGVEASFSFNALCEALGGDPVFYGRLIGLGLTLIALLLLVKIWHKRKT